MFELIQLLGSGERGIALQTRLGRDIPNTVGAAITAQHQRRFQLLLERRGKGWKVRKDPAAGYDCPGHVWASRRTSIYDLEPAWSMILADDGYRQTRHPQPDDLVFYLAAEGALLHIGRIVEVQQGVSPQSPGIPWVVSKWADWTGEVLHNVFQHPYRPPDFDVAIQYWTDRPKQGNATAT